MRLLKNMLLFLILAVLALFLFVINSSGPITVPYSTIITTSTGSDKYNERITTVIFVKTTPSTEEIRKYSFQDVCYDVTYTKPDGSSTTYTCVTSWSFTVTITVYCENIEPTLSYTVKFYIKSTSTGKVLNTITKSGTFDWTQNNKITVSYTGDIESDFKLAEGYSLFNGYLQVVLEGTGVYSKNTYTLDTGEIYVGEFNISTHQPPPGPGPIIISFIDVRTIVALALPTVILFIVYYCRKILGGK